MKTTAPAFSSFAVDDPAAARRFYATTLGLDVRDSDEPGMLELHLGGETPVMVYPKPDHKPAVFTVLNFPVPSVDTAVDELTRAGVTMDRYDVGDFEAGRQGHPPRQRPDDRLVQGPGRQHPVDPRSRVRRVLTRPSDLGDPVGRRD